MATIEDFWQEIDRRMDSKLESALDGLGASSSAPAGTPARSAGVLPVHNNLHHEPPLALESDLASHVVTIASGAALGHVKVGANLSIDGEGILSAASGVTTFEALTDTPASYAGAAGYLLRVNATPNAIEFVDGTTLYAATGHNHDASYAAIGHNHDAAYSAIGHDHAGVYDPAGTAAAAVSAHEAAGGHTQYVQKSGDTMTGDLIVNGAGIGINAIPTAQAPFYMKRDTNSVTDAFFENANTGTSAQSRFLFRNAADDLNALVFALTGINFSGSGAFRQNTAIVLANTNIAGGLSIVARHPSSGDIRFYTGGFADANQRLLLDSLGNAALGHAALATTATNGFLYIRAGSGVPTGAPTGFAGRVPLYYDSTNHVLYAHSGGAWRAH